MVSHQTRTFFIRRGCFFHILPPQAGRASLPLPPGEVSRSDGEGAFFSEQGGTRRQRRKESAPSFSSTADVSFTFYRLVPAGHPCLSLLERCHEVTERVPSSLRKVDLPKAKTEGDNSVFFILRRCYFHILHASCRRGTSFARGGKGCKTPLESGNRPCRGNFSD